MSSPDNIAGYKDGGAMRLELRIARTRGTFSALAGDDERAAVEEAWLVPDRGREDVDLQSGAAPAHPKIGRRLGKEPARAGRAVAPGTADAGWCRERDRRDRRDRRGRRVVAPQLAREAAFAPRDVESYPEMLGDRADIGGRARPIHKGRAVAIDIMVMQLDRVCRYAEAEEVEQGGKAVLAPTERYDEAPVGAEVGEGGRSGHAASRIWSSGSAEASRPVVRSR